MVVFAPPRLPTNWATQVANVGSFEDEEKTYFTVGGRPGRLPTLPAILTVDRYATYSFDFIDGIAINSALTQDLIIQQQEASFVTSGRFGVDSYWAKIQQIGEWLGFEIPAEDEGRLNIEQLVKDAGPELYETSLPNQSGASKERPHSTLVDLVTSLVSVLFHRGGYHRLPALLPESLRRNDRRLNKVAFDDAMSLQDWWIKQQSAILGEFPVKIEMSVNGETRELEAKSIAEILSEVWGLGLDGVVQSDRQNAYNTVILGQALEAHIAALQARDFAAGNADYLGYKADVLEKDLTLAFDPEQRNPQQFFTESTQKILSWKNVDPATASEFFAAINQATEILKLAATRPIERGQPVSDAIERVKSQDRQAWEDYILRYRNPQPSDLPVEPDAQTFTRRITDISNNAGGE